MQKRAFGDLEQAILSILQRGGKMTVKEVHQRLGGGDKYNTIMTVMTRLAQKKVLARARTGLQYTYWILPPKVSPPSFFQQIKQRFFGLETKTMVSNLLKEADDLSEDDLLEIEKMIQNARSKKGKK